MLVYLPLVQIGALGIEPGMAIRNVVMSRPDPCGCMWLQGHTDMSTLVKTAMRSI